MNLKKVILSDISTEAKVSAIALLLDKELPKLTDQVDTVKKLKGEQGDRGLQGDKGNAGRDGKDGKDGRDGKDGSIGKNGKDGEDGVSVVNAKVDFDDTLVLTLSTGKEINVGEVKGEKGENGRDGNTGANGIGVPTGGTSGQILAKNSSLDYDTGWITNSGSGTVTSVAATAGTGISITGSPITTSGTLNITNSAPDQTVVLTAGTGISTSGTYPNFTITNSAPDQTVALTGAGTTSITGTYPNFTITSNDSASGTVTSVAATVPSFLSVAGSPITTSGTLAITLSGTALPIANGGTGATTLAGASIATYTGTETLTNKRIDPRVTSAASASTLTPDISASDVYAYTALAAGLTINAPTGTPVDGDKLIFRLLDNGTSRALTWNATYTVIGVTLPTATTISKTTYVGCIYNANNTRWDVIAVTTQA